MERLWLLGEFTGPGAMVAAAERLTSAGLASATETHSPYPVEAAYVVLGLPRSPMPRMVAAGGLFGVTVAYLVQWWCNAVDYPINVGGRPDHALPSFIPITFEVGVLCAGLAAFFGLWGYLGLPRPHHPLFELERFRSASVDRFWVSVVTTPGSTEEGTVRRLLDEAGAIHVAAVRERELP